MVAGASCSIHPARRAGPCVTTLRQADAYRSAVLTSAAGAPLLCGAAAAARNRHTQSEGRGMPMRKKMGMMTFKCLIVNVFPGR